MSKAPTKQIKLCFFETACTGNHLSPGQWRDEKDNSRSKDRIDYWLNVARLAEKGKILAVFFADAYGHHTIYGGNADAILASGTQVAQFDPMILVPAMASVTKSVSFGVTGSTSYLNPYILSRTYSGMDHLSNGRLAWNVVTSWSKSAARALGQQDVVPHDERYSIAHEYMDVCYKLWESSWADDAQVWDRERRIAYDPAKIRQIDHKGKYFDISGTHQTHPSPQRTPLIFQAGSSKAGQGFAAKHAEAIFIGGLIPKHTTDAVKGIRESAKDIGRDPNSIKIFASMNPIIGRTLEEAEAKYKKALENADIVGALAQFSGFTGIDMSKYPLDEPFNLTGKPGENTVQSLIRDFQGGAGDNGDEVWTPRRLGECMCFGGLHPAPVGTPAMIADKMQEWVDVADVDGFNISYTSNPCSFEDVVELLVPELQRRGMYWDDYAVPGGTLRENMNGVKGMSKLRDDHYGSKFKYDKYTPEPNGGESNGV
ncbi:putative dibenzothiophene desulfurization enzyme A [Xylariales sp. PMI_506]|nr:putative dibenzothiophene desulfurization enzyme A [Xylariales sp. PMI_506]